MTAQLCQPIGITQLPDQYTGDDDYVIKWNTQTMTIIWQSIKRHICDIPQPMWQLETYTPNFYQLGTPQYNHEEQLLIILVHKTTSDN